MIIAVLSLTVSAAAFFFTVMIYRKRRTFENENHFFQYKLQQYGTIIETVSQLLELMHRNFYDLLYEVIDGPDDEVVNEIQEEIDKKMMELRVILHKGCAFIPQKIIDGLDELYDHIIDTQACLEKQEPGKAELEKAIDRIDPLTDELENVINEMRSDLGIENIDMRLKKRAI
ncbi:MAG: hypothetical protein J0I09_08060 [Sphingobacteriia bacterium]|nr:hypothetical protein [Sphingobacteriia bacterium]